MYIQIKTKNPVIWNPINPTDLQNIIIGVDLFIGNSQFINATITYTTESGNRIEIPNEGYRTFTSEEAKQLEQLFNIEFTNWVDYTKEFVTSVSLHIIGQKILFGLSEEDFEVM